MSSFGVRLGFAALVGSTMVAAQVSTITAIPSTSTGSTTTDSDSPITSLSSISYSYTYTYTTPTTVWAAPTFATPAPIPACSEDMCPSLNGDYCQDSAGNMYGVLCDTLFTGISIENSGKKVLKDRAAADEIMKRDYTGTLTECAEFCDMYNDPGASCTGLSYQNGDCTSYDTITGTFNMPGMIAAVRAPHM